MSDNIRCECTEPAAARPLFMANWYSDEERKSWGHQPGKCRSRSDLQLYVRGGRQLWLCSACNLSTDILVEPQPAGL